MGVLWKRGSCIDKLRSPAKQRRANDSEFQNGEFDPAWNKRIWGGKRLHLRCSDRRRHRFGGEHTRCRWNGSVYELDSGSDRSICWQHHVVGWGCSGWGADGCDDGHFQWRGFDGCADGDRCCSGWCTDNSYDWHVHGCGFNGQLDGGERQHDRQCGSHRGGTVKCDDDFCRKWFEFDRRCDAERWGCYCNDCDGDDVQRNVERKRDKCW